MEPRQLVIIAAFAIGGIVARAVRGSVRRWSRRRRFRRGAVAEEEALLLARRAGYRVLGSQVSKDFVMRADREAIPINVRADMIVEKGGRTYVAEVKSGSKAPDPSGTATRRQLLEYAHAFEADGVLLFDMRARRIRRIEFPRRRGSDAPVWIIASGLFGALLEAEFHLAARALGFLASLY